MCASSLTPKLLTGNVSTADFGRAEEVLWWCAHEGETEIVYHLARDPALDVNCRSDPNNAQSTALYVAVYQNQFETVRHLCELRGVDVNLPCVRNFNASPFWLACFRGNLEIVRFMLKLPVVNILHTNDFGLSGRDAALHAGHNRIVQLIDDEIVSRKKREQYFKEQKNNPYGVSSKETSSNSSTATLPAISPPISPKI